mmetsp:Transcript_44820/g.136868  ORF Transcript_44820/g.136868 Transcript_44820/m.136868 type:complete len:96 (-) Transcript_44820:818-1105(-)
MILAVVVPEQTCMVPVRFGTTTDCHRYVMACAMSVLRYEQNGHRLQKRAREAEHWYDLYHGFRYGSLLASCRQLKILTDFDVAMKEEMMHNTMAW